MSACDEAAAFGIDVSLLEANLRLTPQERLIELQAMLQLSEALQAQTLTLAQRDRLERRAMIEEVRAYGCEEDLRRLEAL